MRVSKKIVRIIGHCMGVLTGLRKESISNQTYFNDHQQDENTIIINLQYVSLSNAWGFHQGIIIYYSEILQKEISSNSRTMKHACAYRLHALVISIPYTDCTMFPIWDVRIPSPTPQTEPSLSAPRDNTERVLPSPGRPARCSFVT